MNRLNQEKKDTNMSEMKERLMLGEKLIKELDAVITKGFPKESADINKIDQVPAVMFELLDKHLNSLTQEEIALIVLYKYNQMVESKLEKLAPLIEAFKMLKKEGM